MPIKELTFRGRPYKIAYMERIPQDPSWFSFDDESTVRDRDWNISEGDVVFDIGSAYGSYTLTALVSGASFVHCWNPNNEENTQLKESLSLNGWDDKCTIHIDGLWSSTGHLRETDLAFSANNAVEGGFPVRTLDSYDFNISKLDWMKLDVEGAEVEVLMGAKKIISSLRPQITVENHQFKDATIEARVMNFLVNDLGYTMVRTTPYHGVSHSLYNPPITK